MAKNRKGNFTVTYRFIDLVKADAKRVSVKEVTQKKPCSAEAYHSALEAEKRAASNAGILLVNVIIREDDKVVWTLR